MSEHKYSVDEIDSMRASLTIMVSDYLRVPCADCTNDLTLHYSTFIPQNIDHKKLEEQLRTYMLNGTSPEELTEKAAEVLSLHEMPRIDAYKIAGIDPWTGKLINVKEQKS